MRKSGFDNPHLIQLPKCVEIDIGRTAFILKMCRNKKVLHLGCVDAGLTEERLKTGTLLHTQLLSVAEIVYGVDTNEEGLSLLRGMGIPNLVAGNVEQLDQIPELSGEQFDVIVAAEIIEHLNNPGLFLQSAKKFFHENTVMIITTPNAYRITGFGYRLKGLEFIHPDHNYWFSWSTLTALLSKNGYQIIDARLYSFIDHRRPLIRSLARKVLRLFSRTTTAEKARSSGISSPTVRGKVMRSIESQVKGVAQILSRRFLYKINPFFADGLIFVVRPMVSLEDTEK